MASLREIGQSASDIAREAGSVLAKMGNGILDADLTEVFQFAGISVLGFAGVMLVVLLGFKVDAAIAKASRGRIGLGDIFVAIFLFAFFVVAAAAATENIFNGLLSFVVALGFMFWFIGRRAADREARAAKEGNRQPPD